MPERYEITPSARKDLRSIWFYTAKQWGEPQAERYRSLLIAMFKRIAEGQAASRSFSKLNQELRATRCEHHYIFHMPGKGKRLRIIAVLHERMDMIERLGERLER